MSEDKTAETSDPRSFEERVFACFDVLDERFNDVDARLEKLEAKQYDTKPIWERALAEIAETRSSIEKLRTDIEAGLQGVERKIDVLNRNILDLRADQRYVDSRLEKLESQQVKPS